MSAVHGRNTRVVYGSYNLSVFLKSHNATISAPELDATPYDATARRYVANFQEGSVSMEGFYETDTTNNDKLDDILRAAIDDTSPTPLTIAPEGASTVGSRAVLVEAVETSVNVDDPADGLVMNQASFRGAVNGGTVLAPLTAYTATGNGASVDNGAASSNGAVAHQHITAKSGTTPTNDTIVQHSVDDSVWVDLITFSQKTDVGSERASATGTVNRYLRARRVLGGTSPSFTQLVSVARL